MKTITTKKVLCCKVPTNKGEQIRRILLDNSILNKNYKLKKEDNYLFIPISLPTNTTEIDKPIIENLKKIYKNIEFIEINMLKNPKSNKINFRKYLLKNFKKEIESGDVVLSYDIIGDIVIIQISDNIDENTAKKIGGKALELIPSVKSVYRRKSEILGEFRVRELELLAGEYKTLTLYKENGYRLWVDVEKVYFSPRLSWERKRIMEKVMPEDIVVDMFCGVGPFSIACKNAKKIYAIDINPESIKLLKKNIELNKLQHKIIPINKDIRKTEVKGNRIIMNLPKFAHLFVDTALKMVEKNGIIHYYTVGSNYDEAINLFKSKCNCEIVEKRIVKSYSPREHIFVLDIKIN